MRRPPNIANVHSRNTGKHQADRLEDQGTFPLCRDRDPLIFLALGRNPGVANSTNEN